MKEDQTIVNTRKIIEIQKSEIEKCRKELKKLKNAIDLIMEYDDKTNKSQCIKEILDRGVFVFKTLYPDKTIQ